MMINLFESRYVYLCIIFIFNLFNIVKCNKYALNTKSLKNKLYRTDNSNLYHLVKDNNYNIRVDISYKKIDEFFKDHPVSCHYNSISWFPISSSSVEKIRIHNINYYNEYYHDF